jgi:UMF1 family MFS transporter
MSTSEQQSNSVYKLNDKRVENAWAMFDWANSAYALVITTAVFPLYYTLKTTDETADIPDQVFFLGQVFKNDELLSYSISLAYIIIAFTMPLLSGIADYGGKRLVYMKIFTWLGALSCMSLFFFEGVDNLWLGLGGSMLAVIGFAGGQIFYNSFLPLIVSSDHLDRVSAKGFTMGYFGSVILLVTILVMITFYQTLGLENEFQAMKIGFVMVGLWWIGWAQIPFSRLPQHQSRGGQENIITKGFQELIKVFHALRHQVNTKLFLASFSLYIAAVQTVIAMASVFAVKELGFESTELIMLLLILQIIGALGAWTFSKLSNWKGNKFSLLTIILIWTLVIVASYFTYDKTQYYMVACVVGLVMGGVQSMSRSTYSKLIPATVDNSSSYFSFFDVVEKFSIAIGIFVFGLISGMTNMRTAILSLIVFLIISVILLARVKVEKAG